MFPHFPPYSHLDMLHPYHSSPNSSDIPSDFRAFYPYTPNEVKHRKRTTSTQLRTLENVFKRETKPNAALRNQLAEELKMTPRGVQVWFQNRRAKEKTKANKAKVAAEVAKQQDATPSTNGLPSSAESPNASGTEPQPSKDHPQVQAEQPEITISADSHPCGENAPPPVITPPQLHVFTDPSWNQHLKPATSNDDNTLTMPNQRTTELTHAQLYALRRGSLPIHSPHQGTGSTLLYPPSPLHRRGSVDTNLHRAGLGTNAALSRTTLIRGTRMLTNRSPPLSRPSHSYTQGRPGPHPHHHYMDVRRGSMDSRTMYTQRGTMSPSQPPLPAYHATRGSLPIPNYMYTIPSRTISPPGPGPLPTPNFQFGAASSATAMASSSSGDSDRNSPDSPNSFTYKEAEVDDDNTSVGSYVPHSRFGSFQSIATSESGSAYTDYTNITSALPSPAILNGRRHSCTPAFVGLMSALGVNDAPGSMQEAVIGSSYPHEEAHVANGFIEGGASANSLFNFSPPINDATCTQDPLTAANVPVSRDSELAYALASQPQQTESSKLDAHMLYNHGGASRPSTDLTALRQDSSFFVPDHDAPLGDAAVTAISDYEAPNLTTSEPAYNLPYQNNYLPNDTANEGLQTPMDYTQCGQMTNVYANYGDFGPPPHPLE